MQAHVWSMFFAFAIALSALWSHHMDVDSVQVSSFKKKVFRKSKSGLELYVDGSCIFLRGAVPHVNRIYSSPNRNTLLKKWWCQTTWESNLLSLLLRVAVPQLDRIYSSSLTTFFFFYSTEKHFARFRWGEQVPLVCIEFVFTDTLTLHKQIAALMTRSGLGALVEVFPSPPSPRWLPIAQKGVFSRLCGLLCLYFKRNVKEVLLFEAKCLTHCCWNRTRRKRGFTVAAATHVRYFRWTILYRNVRLSS